MHPRLRFRRSGLSQPGFPRRRPGASAVRLGTLGAVLAGSALVGSAAFSSTAFAAPATPDTAIASAYGVQTTLLKDFAPQSLSPTPVATLGADGTSSQASVGNVSSADLLTATGLQAATSSTAFGTPSESVTSSSQLTGASLNQFTLTFGAISSSCSSGAGGSTGSSSVSSLIFNGNPVTVPTGTNAVLDPADLGNLANVIQVTFNSQTSSDAAGTTSKTVDAVQITLLTDFLDTSTSQTLGAGSVFDIGNAQCSASGLGVNPQLDTTTPPVITGITPTSGVVGGGNQVQVVGTNLCGVTSVAFGNFAGTGISASPNCQTVTVTVPAGQGTVPVSLVANGRSATSPVDYTYTQPGYWEAAADGGVFSFGGAQFYGSTGNIKLNQPIVAMADTPDHGGYWLFARDGGVFAFGDAGYYGSVPGVLGPLGRGLNAPIVAAEATPDGKGYQMFAADGGVFSFGDAGFTGSLPGIGVVPNLPITAAVSTPIGQGYLLVAGDGGVFTFGDGIFEGSLGGQAANGIVSLSETADGNGYWVFAANGAVHPFGDAVSFGDASAAPLPAPVVFGTATSTGQGYWLFGADGSVYNYGDAPALGSLANTRLTSPIVGGIGF
jgi:IPT/TIG domain